MPRIIALDHLAMTRPTLSVTALTAIVSLWCLILLNLPLWSHLLELRPVDGAHTAAFLASFALLSGLAFGKHKMSPLISPKKTWEGAIGGMFGVFVLAWVWMQLEQTYQWPGKSLFTQMMSHGVFLWALSLVFLTAMSVVGDLVESLVKRSAGVKDSSNLLPGHGGVLDRLDALLPALPIAMMLLHWPKV